MGAAQLHRPRAGRGRHAHPAGAVPGRGDPDQGSGTGGRDEEAVRMSSSSVVRASVVLH